MPSAFRLPALPRGTTFQAVHLFPDTERRSSRSSHGEPSNQSQLIRAPKLTRLQERDTRRPDRAASNEVMCPRPELHSSRPLDMVAAIPATPAQLTSGR